MTSTDDIPPAPPGDYDPVAEVETSGEYPDAAQEQADGEHPNAGELVDPDLNLAELEQAEASEAAQD